MKVIRWIDDHLEEAILIVLLVCMACIMIVQVVSRYLFNYSISWSEELTQYLFVWATFLSVSFCVKKRISIKIEQFLNILPDQGKTFLRLLRHTLVIIFCIVMLPYCVTYVQQAIDSQATSAALGLPMVYIQSAPLVGFILLLIRVIQAWIREIKNFVRGFCKQPAAEDGEPAAPVEPVHYKYEDASFEKQFAEEHPVVSHPLADLPHAEHVLEKMAEAETTYARPLTADKPIKEQLAAHEELDRKAAEEAAVKEKFPENTAGDTQTAGSDEAAAAQTAGADQPAAEQQTPQTAAEQTAAAEEQPEEKQPDQEHGNEHNGKEADA